MIDTILTFCIQSCVAMRPLFEHVSIEAGQSWALLWRELPEIPFIWHYHPEFELTLTLNARGQRYIGEQLADFAPGDLVLVGPNLPHTWAASERPDPSQPMLAVVVWFTPSWLEGLLAQLPELAPLRRLLQQGGRGLAFSAAAAARAQPHLLGLQARSAAERIPLLLEALLILAQDLNAAPISSQLPQSGGDASRQRLDRVLAHLHRHFAEPPDLPALAALAALSLGAFQRFFKRHTGHSVLSYLSQLRIGHACQLLIQTDKPIGVIASEVGYRNLAHFNRQFLASKQLTPSALRARYPRAQEAMKARAGLP